MNSLLSNSDISLQPLTRWRDAANQRARAHEHAVSLRFLRNFFGLLRRPCAPIKAPVSYPSGALNATNSTCDCDSTPCRHRSAARVSSHHFRGSPAVTAPIPRSPPFMEPVFAVAQESSVPPQQQPHRLGETMPVQGGDRKSVV